MVLGWMVLISYLMRNQSALVHTKKYNPEKLGSFNKCDSNKPDCLTLGVVLVDENPEAPIKEWIDKAISSISGEYRLEKDSDYKMLYRGSNYEDLYDKMQEFSEIKSMVTFCNDFLFFQNSTMSLSCDEAKYSLFSMDVNLYGIHYNSTSLAPNFLRDTGTPIESDRNAILLKKTIDETILNHYNPARLSLKERFLEKEDAPSICRTRYYKNSEKNGGSNLLSPEALRSEIFSDGNIPEYESEGTEANQDSRNPKKCENCRDGRKIDEKLFDQDSADFSYDISIMDYPKPKNRFIDKFDSSNEWGSFFYLFIILLTYIRFAQMIAKEKDEKLRKGLIPLGLSHFSYWASWLVCIMLFDIVFVWIIVLVGMGLGFPIFVNITVVLTYPVLLLCLWAYRFLAVMVVVCTDNFRSASKSNYTVLVVSLFLQSIIFYIFGY